MKGYDVLKKLFLRLTVLLCSAVFIFTACKNRDGAAQSTVYKSETVEIASEIMGDFDSFTYSGGKIYFLSEVIPSDEENYSAYYLNSADTDGKTFLQSCFLRTINTSAIRGSVQTALYTMLKCGKTAAVTNTLYVKFRPRVKRPKQILPRL